MVFGFAIGTIVFDVFHNNIVRIKTVFISIQLG